MKNSHRTNTGWIANEIISQAINIKRVPRSREELITMLGETLHCATIMPPPWVGEDEIEELEKLSEYTLGCAYKLSLRRNFSEKRER